MTLLKTIQISASILSADMANLTAVTEGLERDGLDMLHFDVMDGQFVPNITFGMPVLAAVDHCTNLFLDVHLMIADPIRYVKQFAEAGADLITFHIESNSDPAATIAAIHEAGVKAGIVLKPNTPWEEAIPYLEQVEVVLVMTVEPGFGGQAFLCAVDGSVHHALRPVAGVQFLGDLLIGDGSGLDLINSHGAVFIGENAVCPAFQRKGDAAGFPLRAEEYLGLIALPGGLLQLAVDACALVGAVKAGKAAVDAAGAQQKLHQLPDGQTDVGHDFTSLIIMNSAVG